MSSMSNISITPNQPLGFVLQQAGLISARQVQIALVEQSHSDRRLGSVLADHGWVKQASADFFAEIWPSLRHQTGRQLGQYLEQAALLSSVQVESILDLQRRTSQKFGTLAIQAGWVSRRTINFFLNHLGRVSTDPSFAIASESELLKEQILENETVNPFALLLLYQQVLQQGFVTINNRPEQQELLEMGLVTAAGHKLKIAQGAASSLLDPQWVAQSLEQLHPYDWIRLKLLKLAEHSDYPYRTLTAILAWTNNHVGLTHRLGWIIHKSGFFISAGEEDTKIGELVQTHIVQNWESGAASGSLKQLSNRICNHPNSHLQLLLYQRILEQREVITTNSLEEQELLTAGLITKQNNTLSVANRIYRLVFDYKWVTQALATPIASSQTRSSDEGPQFEVDTENIEKTTAIPTFVATKPRRTALAIVLFVAALCVAAVGSTAFITTQLWQRSTPEIGRNVTSPLPITTASSTAPQPQAPASQQFKNFQDGERSSGRTQNSELSVRVEYVGPTGTDSNSERQTVSEKADFIVSASDPTFKVPIFQVGSTLDQIVGALGPPTWNRRGYYAGSRALLYESIVPKRVDLGYLVSKSTGRLRQTEIAFERSVPLKTIQFTFQQLLPQPVPASVKESLTQIYKRQINKHDFQVGDYKGNMHWQPEGWIYIGIWETDFHE